jgi:CRP-like cAMP-binding protein
VSGETESLKALPLFRGLTDADMEIIVSMMDEIVVPQGNLLFKQGAMATSLYVVRSGSIEVAQADADGREQVVATVGAGDCLGEMALVRQTTRSGSARAKETASILVLKADKLETLASRQPQAWGRLQKNIASILADRLEAISRELWGLRSVLEEAEPAKRGLFARLLGR